MMRDRGPVRLLVAGGLVSLIFHGLIFWAGSRALTRFRSPVFPNLVEISEVDLLSLPDPASQPASGPKADGIKSEPSPASPVDGQKSSADVAKPVRSAAPTNSQPSDATAARAIDSAPDRAAVPNYSENQPPEYPEGCRHRHEQGTVLLRVVVGEDGRPAKVSIQRGSGFSQLDRAAVKAVEHWSFTAAQRGSGTKASVIDVPIQFELR